MGKFIKENWFRLGLLTILIISIVGAFYWYQWRPNQIRHNCSWTKRHSDAISEITQEQYGKCVQERNKCVIDNKKKSTNPTNPFLGLFDCPDCPPARSAQPVKDWWEQANKNEYDFCIHEKGL